MDGERATGGRPYTEKADRSYKLSVFWNGSGIISVHRFHLDFVGATSGRPLSTYCTYKIKTAFYAFYPLRNRPFGEKDPPFPPLKRSLTGVRGGAPRIPASPASLRQDAV